jgi:hypothetical protein
MAIEAGNRLPSAAAHGKHGHSLISDAKFRQLFELALKLQLVSQQHGGDGAGWLLDREAALAGVIADMRGNDGVVATYATSVDEIARGQVAVRMDRRSFEERVIEALSDATGDRLRKTERITAIFFDESGSRVMQEARALAIAARLPVLFVDYARRERKSSAKSKKPAPLEYPSIPVHTRDVIAMYRVAHESIARARDGGGPTHIVSVEWQLMANGAGRAAKTKAEDAVEHLEQWLIARGLPAQEWRREIVGAFETGGREQVFGVRTAIDGAMENEDAETLAIA